MYRFHSSILPYDLVKIPFNEELKFHLTEKVDVDILKSAVSKAQGRYPYLSLQIVRQDEKLVYIPNERPISVREYDGNVPPLNGSEVNFHLLAIEYSDKDIHFFANHTICNGQCINEFTRTTLYLYHAEKYQREFKVDGVKLPRDLAGDEDSARMGDVISKAEYAFPDYSEEFSGEPKGLWRIKSGEPYVKDYINVMKNPELGQNSFYKIIIDEKELTPVLRATGNSPSSLFAALMFRVLDRVWAGHEKPIVVRIAQNYRNDVGLKESLADMTRAIFVTYPDSFRDADLEKLGLITRGTVLVQTQEDFVRNDVNTAISRAQKVENCPTLAEKIEYAGKDRSILGPDTSCNVSYTGRMNLGELEPYIEDVDIIVSGHLTLECTALNGRFIVYFSNILKDDIYIRELTHELEKENIKYTVQGPIEVNLPGIVI